MITSYNEMTAAHILAAQHCEYRFPWTAIPRISGETSQDNAAFRVDTIFYQNLIATHDQIRMKITGFLWANNWTYEKPIGMRSC